MFNVPQGYAYLLSLRRNSLDKDARPSRVAYRTYTDMGTKSLKNVVTQECQIASMPCFNGTVSARLVCSSQRCLVT